MAKVRRLHQPAGGVFICWSGPRGEKLAELCRGFLEGTLPPLKGSIFASPQIEKGARWFEEVIRQLETSHIGIICMTPESLLSPWLHFESGALLRGMHITEKPERRKGEPVQNRAFTLLHGVPAARLAGPLSQYQSTSTTQSDTRSLFRTIARVLGLDWDERSEARFRSSWLQFERGLRQLELPVQQLIPAFEGWFQRKTFEEPLDRCTDQAWVARYDGARQTHDRLMAQREAVRAACPRYAVDLYEYLLMLLESYTMDIRALLLRARPFVLQDSGRLDVPKGVLSACEGRRRSIKEVLSRILDPLGVPVTGEAARYWLSDSFDQRKMLIHRCQHDIASARERPRTMQNLPDVERAHAMTNSVWELDRIHGYLLAEFVYCGARDAAAELVHEAAAEVERLKGHRTDSVMPLYYAMRALRTALRPGAARNAVRASVSELQADVRALIASSRTRKRGQEARPLDRGGQVRRVMKDIDALLGRSKSPRRTAAPLRLTRRSTSAGA